MSEPDAKIIAEGENMIFYCRENGAISETLYIPKTHISEINTISDIEIQTSLPRRIHNPTEGISNRFPAIHGHLQGISTPFSNIPVSDLSISDNRYMITSDMISLRKNVSITKPKTSLDKFLDRLEYRDRNLVLESLNFINSLPYVVDIKLEEISGHTIIVTLSQMDEDVEDKIYQIEYDLLKSFENNIDFLVFPA